MTKLTWKLFTLAIRLTLLALVVRPIWHADYAYATFLIALVIMLNQEVS